jgi:hypothetical protein
MHLSKHEIPVRIEVPGAVARQLPDFGTPTGTFGVEYFSLAAGTDLAPLLEGLEGDVCHSAHWGYLQSGDVVVTYADGRTEGCKGGEVFHWPAGHSVRVEADAEIILFSPQVEHGDVLDHIGAKLAATG